MYRTTVTEADTRSKSDAGGNFQARFEVSLSRVIWPGFLLAILSTIAVSMTGFYGNRRLATDMITAADFVCVLFTITWLFFAGILIKRTLRKLDNSRRSLSELNQNLELRVAERSAALQSQTNMLQSILESMTESVVVVDRDERLKLFNPASVRTLLPETDLQQLGNGSWRKAFQIYRGSETEPITFEEMPISAALAGQESDRIELRVVDAISGRQIWVEASARPIRDADGKVAFAVLAFHDVTGHKRADQELRWARDLAIESARRRAEFLSTMSHEIRTPLNGILGTTQLLQLSDLNPEQREFADTVLSSANTLLVTVNDILDFSRLTEGKVELDKTEFDLVSVLEATRDKFLERARKKALDLVLKVDHQVPRQLRGDPAKLRQVLDHLVSNAVKFTDRGEVIIRGRKTHEDDQIASIRIDIRDTGIGIAPEVTRRLFQPFSQTDGFISRKHDGTGLGLVISERLIELMGGNIALSSQLGIGSTFHFTLDFDQPTSSVAVARNKRRGADHDRRRKTRVLVVDSTLVDRLVAATQLKKLGYLADTVESGEQAQQALVKANYDVVLMDCETAMSDHDQSHDGYQVAIAIRDREGDARHTTVIAMTARDPESVKESCLAAGIDDYLGKPIKLEVLSAMLERWASPALSDSTPPPGKPGPFTAARTRSKLGHSAPERPGSAPNKGAADI